MSLQLEDRVENNLIRLATEEFGVILAPVLERVGNRAFILTEHPPKMKLTDEWFGQGIYRRRGFNNLYAVLEMDDHFLIYQAGVNTQLYRQDKLGIERHTPIRATTVTMRADEFIPAVQKLNEKYA